MLDIQVGPLGGILFWLLVALVAVGVLLSVTMSGLLVWVLGSVVVIGVAWIIGRRTLGKATGRRR